MQDCSEIYFTYICIHITLEQVGRPSISSFESYHIFFDNSTILNESQNFSGTSIGINNFLSK